MLNTVRRNITASLWQHYCQFTPEMRAISAYFEKNNLQPMVLDHVALIDLPGPHSGIPVLSQLFQQLGYTSRGTGYLPDKQNDFLWMAEVDVEKQPAAEALPQVVVADFRLAALPEAVSAIIEKYAALALPPPVAFVESAIEQIQAGNAEAASALTACVVDYLTTRSWPLPTAEELQTVQAANELMAWVLLFGHQPNHFAIALHHCPTFESLAHAHDALETACQIALNEEGGKIKGDAVRGIEQSSTCGTQQDIMLEGGTIRLPTGFAELVWRHPHRNAPTPPHAWSDYFTGFVASQANYVIESLYLYKKEDNLSEV